MRVSIFGAEGMLGAALMRTFPDALGTTRRTAPAGALLPGIDIIDAGHLQQAFDWARPEVVINCAGVVKSECGGHDSNYVNMVNGFVPHSIAALAYVYRCRFIQISTDCVFSGKYGARNETDECDATDLYGRSKAAGELADYTHCLTLRTSFVGRDPVHKRGLLEWLLAKTGEVPGYTRALWSGLSTIELARVIARVIEDESLSGLYHVAGPPITKAALLEALADAYDIFCRIDRQDGPYIDRTLDGSKFAQRLNYTPPSWVDMAQELAKEQP